MPLGGLLMPTGKPLKFEYFRYEDIKKPRNLEPPPNCHRVYLHAEVAYIRYLVTEDRHEIEDGGFPLLADYPDEFDTDLQNIWVVAGAPDAALSVYWFGS